jgi:hypothetical protein
MGIKRPEREPDHLPPSSYDAKNGTMNPPVCVHGVSRDEITSQLTDLLFCYVRHLPSTCPSVCLLNGCSCVSDHFTKPAVPVDECLCIPTIAVNVLSTKTRHKL